MARRPRRKEPVVTLTVNVAVRVPADLADAFEEVARSEDRTVSAELRRLMRLRVAEVLPQGGVGAA
jgi:hypothetical protein